MITNIDDECINNYMHLLFTLENNDHIILIQDYYTTVMVTHRIIPSAFWFLNYE